VLSRLIVRQFGGISLDNDLHHDKQTNTHQTKRLLVEETLSLLEVLIWSCPDDDVPLLSTIPHTPILLTTLTSPLRPSWVLRRGVRMLSFLASHSCLYPHFLVSPDNSGDGKAGEAGNVKHIEQLASLLVGNGNGDGIETLTSLREDILTFFATLSISHPDARSSLLRSYTLIPSIVLFLANVSSSLWEEDEELVTTSMMSEEKGKGKKVNSIISLCSQTISLLYFLLCSPFPTPSPPTHITPSSQPSSQPPQLPTYDINKFHNMTGPFNGIFHIYILTFGRFSFADPPEWVDEEGKVILEYVADMARELLELGIDGPELEMIWGAFQFDPDSAKKGRVMRDEFDEEGGDGGHIG